MAEAAERGSNTLPPAVVGHTIKCSEVVQYNTSKKVKGAFETSFGFKLSI